MILPVQTSDRGNEEHPKNKTLFLGLLHTKKKPVFLRFFFTKKINIIQSSDLGLGKQWSRNDR